ncbi:MAG: NADPH-dependent FMN reductase [Planctomycetaceae bacterium]
MSAIPKILAVAGSLRSDSYNKKLGRLAAEAARAAGAEATFLDLRDLPLPIFDQDFEAREGLPDNARKLKQLLLAHDGLVIASPEYNSSITAVLKNAIDWASRPESPNEANLACFVGKVAALVSTSPGALGGLRGLVHLRSILGNIRVLVLPDQLAVPRAPEAFDADGTLKDSGQQATLERIVRTLVTTVARLKG